MNKYLLFFLMISVIGLSSCLKDKNDPYQEAEEQFMRDTALMNTYVKTNDIDVVRHESGVMYQIIEPGTGDFNYTTATRVTVKYEGKLLNGTVFDKTDTEPRTFTLGQLISGWQIGIPLIEKGGKIRLIVPSGYAYGPSPRTGIPANSILDFTIELIDVQ